MASAWVVPGGRLFHAFRGCSVAQLRAARVHESRGDYDGAAAWYARAEADARIAGVVTLAGAAARGLARVAEAEAVRRVAERELEAEYDAWVARGAWGWF